MWGLAKSIDGGYVRTVQFGGMPATASLRALLAHSIDYAGLFPPCSLELDAAIQKQAEYVRSNESWMLSSFVLPIARFDELSGFVSAFDKAHPVRISALGPKLENASAFVSAVAGAAPKITSLEQISPSLAVVSQLEMSLPADVD